MGVTVREKQKGSNDWWIFIRHAGQRISQRAGDNKEAAEEAAAEMRKEIRIGKFDIAAMKAARAPEVKKEEKPAGITMAEYYERFKRVYLETSVRKGTRGIYSTSFNQHILPFLGPISLDQITREKIKDFVAHLVTKKYEKRTKVKTYPVPDKLRNPEITWNVEAVSLSRTSIRIILSQLCALFSHALEESVISANPALKLGKFYKQSKVVHDEVQPLAADEVPTFLQAVLDRPASVDYYPVFLCAIHTGMRAGELVGLHWGDIDFRGKFLVVRRCFTRGRIEGTKTGKTRRVDLSDSLLQELQSLKRKRQADYLAKGKNEIPDWVFCNQEGNPLDYYNLKHRHFEKCLEAAKLRRIRFHDLRHTFASLLIQNGESLAYIKDQLGHSSIKMTVDVYGHLVPGANRAAVNRLPTLRPVGVQVVAGRQ